ncbi:QRFP-like peptide receptor isoform X1 [Montipora capricornis]|uniref:QRFP-like peptide receptor isoform X1 n=2 Tax=Montipora capricornis TaxID=246305 RepID=UPI0035F101FE
MPDRSRCDRLEDLINNGSQRELIRWDDPTFDCPEEEEYTPVKRYTRTTLYVVAMLVSLFGNSTVVWIVRKNRNMRTLTHYLIVNMAVADLLITVFHMPYKLKVQLTNSYAVIVGGLIGTLICKLVGYIQDVSIASSILSLTVISVDRFLVVRFPLKHVTLLKRPRFVIVPIWIISAFMCSPLLYANKMIEYDGDFYCNEEWPPLRMTGSDYTIIQFTVLYALPLVIITVLYSCIVFKVWHRSIPGQAATEMHRGQRPHSQARKKLLKLLIIIVSLFAACWLPYHVIFFLNFFSEKYVHCDVPDTIMFYCLFVGHANSAINPCIYFVIHNEYRMGLIQLTRLICSPLRKLTFMRCRFRQFRSFDLQTASNDGSTPTEQPL